MPWSRGKMDDRQRMIQRWESGRVSITQLAREFGVSRQTIHTWINRWSDPSEETPLEDRSTRPYTSPRKTPLELERLLLSLKERHPDYGPDKLSALLALDHSITLAAPTARDILRRNGLVQARGPRMRRWSPEAEPVINVPGPGHSMSADYKGQFLLGNRTWCYPLTIADPGSRYVFAVEAMRINHGRQAKVVFERVFREWGLPEQIITDNGAPFCVSQSIGGISELSRWWTRLGVRHVRTQPGRPQQNGIHERMHRTLKAKATKPPARTGSKQQANFDGFMAEYNHVRPHQGLGQKRPATVVERYRRAFPAQLPEVEYPSSFTVRRVRGNGCINWLTGTVYVGSVLKDEPVGLVQSADDRWQLYFSNRHLADWCERTSRWVEPDRDDR